MNRLDVQRIKAELKTMAAQYKAAAIVRKYDIDEKMYWTNLEGDCWKAICWLCWPSGRG